LEQGRRAGGRGNPTQSERAQKNRARDTGNWNPSVKEELGVGDAKLARRGKMERRESEPLGRAPELEKRKGASELGTGREQGSCAWHQRAGCAAGIEPRAQDGARAGDEARLGKKMERAATKKGSAAGNRR
jgi:hypothetical protein